MSNNHESWQTVISRRFGYYGPTLYGCRMREFLSAVLLTSICLCYSRGQELRPSGWSLQTPYQNPTGERQVTLGVTPVRSILQPPRRWILVHCKLSLLGQFKPTIVEVLGQWSFMMDRRHGPGT